jgi:hypothetical protein
MKPKTLLPLIQIVALVAVCGLSAFTALTGFGALGGVSMALAPQPVFGLVEAVVCPQDAAIEYSESHASYNPPGEYQLHVECARPDGSRSDVTLQAIGAVLAGSFLACFLPLALPGTLLALVVPLLFKRRLAGGNES